MLMITDLLEVAHGRSDLQAQRLRAPTRYASGVRRAPVVVWNISRQCNMTCPHCYIAARPFPVKHELTTAQALALLDNLAAGGVRMLIVSGGEPLLRPDLFELLRHARALGISHHLSTNGVLIDEQVAALLKDAGTQYVGISIDGPREFNDAYRGLPGGFELAVRGLRLAKAAGLRTGLRMTLTRDNVAYLERMLELACDVDADRFYVSHLVYAGRGFAMSDRDLDAAGVRAVLQQLFVLAERLLQRGHGPRIVTGSNDSDGPLLLEWIVRRHGDAAAAPVRQLLEARGGNSAGEGIIAIDSRGWAHPDQFWQRAVLGNAGTTPLAQIMDHPLCHQLRRRQRLLTGRCDGCAHVALCRGSHRERALARFGHLWASDPACVMTDEEIGAGRPVLAAGAGRP